MEHCRHYLTLDIDIPENTKYKIRYCKGCIVDLFRESVRRKNEEYDRLKTLNDPNKEIMYTGMCFGFDNYEYLNVRPGKRFLWKEKDANKAWKEDCEFKSIYKYNDCK